MRSLLAMIMLSAVLLTACAASGGDDTVASTDGAAAAPQATGADSRPIDFIANTVQGDEFVGGDYAGQDLMLWFWAPW